MVTINPTPKRIAMLIEQNFEDAEFRVPYTALQQAGAEVILLGSRINDTYLGKSDRTAIEPDGTTTEARPENFDAVIIPGGMAPDTMRNNPNTVQFVREALELGKLVAAIGHGSQVLIEGDLLRGKNATGSSSIRQDTLNAGANYLDEPLVVCGNLLTSRQPGDLPIFTTAILTRLGLAIPDRTLPAHSDNPVEWWELAEAWGVSTKGKIVNGLNTALAGERHGDRAFTQYAQKVSDPELRSLLQQIARNKQHHIRMLENRLNALDAEVAIPSPVTDTDTNGQDWFATSDDLTILRRALEEIQTGVVDAYNLHKQFTDPTSTALFAEIEANLAQDEQRLAQAYHSRISTPTPQPTTGSAIGL
jgi:protease I